MRYTYNGLLFSVERKGIPEFQHLAVQNKLEDALFHEISQFLKNKCCRTALTRAARAVTFTRTKDRLVVDEDGVDREQSFLWVQICFTR